MHHGDATLEISKYVGILQKLFKVPWCNTYVLRRHTRFLEKPFIKVGNFFQSSPATVSLSPLLYLLLVLLNGQNLWARADSGNAY